MIREGSRVLNKVQTAAEALIEQATEREEVIINIIKASSPLALRALKDRRVFLDNSIDKLARKILLLVKDGIR